MAMLGFDSILLLLRFDSSSCIVLIYTCVQLLYRYHGGLDGPNRTCVLVSYLLSGVVVSFIELLTRALPADCLLLGQDTHVCFVDSEWLLCASSK